MFHAPAIVCALLSACAMAALAQIPSPTNSMQQDIAAMRKANLAALRAMPGPFVQAPMLSPAEKTNLRTARLGLPAPADTNRYRVTAVSRDDVAWRTQTLALTTVTIVTAHSNKPPVLVWRNGVYEPYVPASRPVVISVVTQHFDVLRALEVKP